MNETLISIIVPVYNVEKYLSKCLNSILVQTYKKLQIILIDDGSVDNSGKICDEYAKTDNRIEVIHQKNLGVSSARNKGLEAAKGKWIGFIDSDDCIEPDMFEYLIKLVYKYNVDIAQCGIFFEENKTKKRTYCPQKDIFKDSIKSFDYCDWDMLSNSTCNKLYSVAILKNILYDVKYPVGEDLLFNLQAMKNANGIVLGVQAKYHYMQRMESVCHSEPTLHRLESYHNVLNYVINLFDLEYCAKRYFETEQIRNDMDMSSKIVRFYHDEFEPCKNKITKRLRIKTNEFIKNRELMLHERMKLLLIGWCWPLYRILLLASKKLK